MRRPEPRKRNNPETDVQREVIKEIRSHYGWISVAHIPNGGWRNPKEGAVLKANGVLPGMPDLILWTPGKGVGFIEMKAPGKAHKVTDHQSERMSELSDAGSPVAVADSLEMVLNILKEWGWIER